MKLTAQATTQSLIDFEASLRPALRSVNITNRAELSAARRIVVLFQMPPSKFRDRRMKRLHDRAEKWATKNGGKVRRNGAIDWANFDWKSVLTVFLAFVGAILPIIFGSKKEQ